MVCTICSSQCLCMPSFLHQPTPPTPTPPLCIPSPSLFQHLCWVHARASDKALCVPSLGNLPRFSSCLPAPPSWKPHNCLPLSPTILLQPVRSPRGQQTQPGPERNTLKLLNPHLPRKGGALGRRWIHHVWTHREQPLHIMITHFATLVQDIKVNS